MRPGFDVERLFAIHASVVGPDMAGLTDQDAAATILLEILAEMDERVGSIELYAGVLPKAVVLCQGITTRLPFQTGNWKTALAALRVYLRLNGVRLQAPVVGEEDLFVYDLAAGELDVAAATAWLADRTVLG